MIGVDTNILVRVLVGDTPDQTKKALEFLSQRSADDPAYVSPVVLVEVVWVLQRTYGYVEKSIRTALDSLFESANILIEQQDLMYLAIVAAEENGADIADCIIASLAADRGSDRTMTFDRDAAKRIPGMALLK